ncbi:MAG: putative anti-sigma regulatory factor, serine/threonine protein kinase [Actinoallomurus sp.]|nr:putative anti-sigma regulatory factor, serine/threonine protein kinase [Actinoallomurus sp.]
MTEHYSGWRKSTFSNSSSSDCVEATMRIPLTETTPSDGESGGIQEGGCSAWRLPPDETCAAVARSLIRETLTALGLGGDVIHDAATMVSELATNAFEHASPRDPLPPATPQYAVGGSELWLYRSADRLVCKVFDTFRCWKDAPAPRSGEDLAEHGRGLGVVHVPSDATTPISSGRALPVMSCDASRATSSTWPKRSYAATRNSTGSADRGLDRLVGHLRTYLSSR